MDPYLANAGGGAMAAGTATAAGTMTDKAGPGVITLVFETLHIAELGAMMGTLWATINVIRWGYSVIADWRNRWQQRGKTDRDNSR